MHDEFESDRSNLEENLQYIRLEDRENLERVVRALKDSGFYFVYLTGSSLEREDYDDIDLVVKNLDPEKEDLYTLIEKLEKEHGISDIETKVEKTKIDEWREQGGRISGWSTSQLGPYANSVILERYSFRLGNSRFDISHSYEPFELNEAAKKVML